MSEGSGTATEGTASYKWENLTGPGSAKAAQGGRGSPRRQERLPGSQCHKHHHQPGLSLTHIGAGRGHKSVRQARQWGPVQHSRSCAHQKRALMVAMWNWGPRVAELSKFS